MPLLARSLTVLMVLAGSAVTAATPAHAATGTRPDHDYAAAIREQVWVQTPVDSDSDGRPDRVAVRIIRPGTTRTAGSLAAAPDAADPNRFAHLTAPLTADVRLTGTPRISVRADLAGDSPYLTALLVDHGTADRFVRVRTLAEQDCVGPGIEGDPGCFARREYVTAPSDYEIVTRGWIDVRNRISPSWTTPVTAGEAYTFRFALQSTDHVFAAGHRIGVVLISTDRDHTLRYPSGTVVGVRPGASFLTARLSRLPGGPALS